MRPMTAAAKAAILDGHGVTLSAEVVDLAGTHVAWLDSIGDDATLTLDSNALVRRHVQFSLPDTTAILPISGGYLDPSMVNLIKVTAGVTWLTGADSWGIGTFVITDPHLVDPSSPNVTVQGYDLALLVSRWKLSESYGVVAGTQVGTAISDLIDFAWQGPSPIPKAFFPPAAAMPAGIVVNTTDDPMAVAASWAAGMGCDLYFDATGTLVLRQSDFPFTRPPSWYYADGADAILLEIAQTFSVQDSFSHVIALGNSLAGGAPVRADAYDTNPSSPTYYLGPFGDVPTTINLQTVDNPTTAMDAAMGELARKKGVHRTIEFQTVPVSSHDEQDIIGLTRDASDLSGTNLFMIEALTIPLGYVGASQVRCQGRLI